MDKSNDKRIILIKIHSWNKKFTKETGCRCTYGRGKIIKFPEMKIVDDDFEVELGLSATRNNAEYIDLREQDIINGLNEVNEALSSNNKRIDELNNKRMIQEKSDEFI